MTALPTFVGHFDKNRPFQSYMSLLRKYVNQNFGSFFRITYYQASVVVS